MNNNNHKPRFYPTRIDLSAEIRSEAVEILNQTLATTVDLKTQVKQAHWNVKGMNFYQLHELFDEIARELEEYVDKFAERIIALGSEAMGTARIAAKYSSLSEYPFNISDESQHLIALADRFATYARLVRDAADSITELGDATTADLYTKVSRVIDKRLWFLEAHLQAREMNSVQAREMNSGYEIAAIGKEIIKSN